MLKVFASPSVLAQSNDIFLHYFRKRSILEYALVDQEFIGGDFLHVGTFKKEKWYALSLPQEPSLPH